MGKIKWKINTKHTDIFNACTDNDIVRDQIDGLKLVHVMNAILLTHFYLQGFFWLSFNEIHYPGW